MDIVIQKTAADAAAFTAGVLADAIRKKPNMTLGLATGRTMENLYALLADMYRAGTLDFSLVKSFNLDEYVGLSPEDPNSYHAYMKKHLFRHTNIDMRNTHVPDGIAKDLEAAAALYEEQIRESGGLDIQLVGIGRTGHIGFNEPLSPLASRTRTVLLTPVTRRQNEPLFARPEDMPSRAVTMGVGTVMDARQVIMLATGEEKAEIIAKTVEGPVTFQISATALQFHRNCLLVLDEGAASKLAEKDLYRWAFENDPRWAK